MKHFARERLLPIIVAYLVFRSSKAKRDGAPTETCGYMVPAHFKGSASERNPRPASHQDARDSRYVIDATWVDRGKYIRLNVTGPTLKGFLIQARQNESGPAIGKFVMLTEDSKYQKCERPESPVQFDPEASVTHTNSTIKKELSFLWSPPAFQKGNITFYATIVKSKEVFWVKLPSNTIDLSARPNGGALVSLSWLANVAFFTLTLLIRTLTV